MTNRIEGRTALVTGGTSGLGLVMARALLAAGARVCVTGRRQTAVDAALANLDPTGEDCRGVLCDVSQPESITALHGTLADEDVSILVNNAGVAGPVRPLVEIDVDEWDDTMNTNVRGVFLMCKAFVPAMIAAGRGDIVNIASVSGKRPLARRTPYTTSKMAILGLTRTLALELGTSGISVNTLSPGPVSGERMARLFEAEAQLSSSTPEEAEKAFTSRAALARLVDSDDVGRALVAMLGLGSFTGADLDLSAGMIAPS